MWKLKNILIIALILVLILSGYFCLNMYKDTLEEVAMLEGEKEALEIQIQEKDTETEKLEMHIEEKNSEIENLTNTNNNLEFGVRNTIDEMFYGEWEITGVIYMRDQVPTRLEFLILDYSDYSTIGIYKDKLTLDGKVVVEQPVYRVHIEPVNEMTSDGKVQINDRYNPKWDFQPNYICYVFTYDKNELDHVIGNTLGRVIYIKDENTILLDIGNNSEIEAKRIIK